MTEFIEQTIAQGPGYLIALAVALGLVIFVEGGKKD
jgi:hypothetical protein